MFAIKTSLGIFGKTKETTIGTLLMSVLVNRYFVYMVNTVT